MITTAKVGKLVRQDPSPPVERERLDQSCRQQKPWPAKAPEQGRPEVGDHQQFGHWTHPAARLILSASSINSSGAGIAARSLRRKRMTRISLSASQDHRYREPRQDQIGVSEPGGLRQERPPHRLGRGPDGLRRRTMHGPTTTFRRQSRWPAIGVRFLTTTGRVCQGATRGRSATGT